MDGATSAARERVLDTAEQLFSERGYTAVTLRDIASTLQMQKASLYHHAPEGKEGLFVEVMKRHLTRHQRGLEEALAGTQPTLQKQLEAAAHWFLSQPPVNLARMTRSDLPALSEEHAQQLAFAAHQALLVPLGHIFVAAGITQPEPTLLAGTFISMVETVQDAQRYSDTPSAIMMEDIINVLLYGLKQR